MINSISVDWCLECRVIINSHLIQFEFWSKLITVNTTKHFYYYRIQSFYIISHRLPLFKAIICSSQVIFKLENKLTWPKRTQTHIGTNQWPFFLKCSIVFGFEAWSKHLIYFKRSISRHPRWKRVLYNNARSLNELDENEKSECLALEHGNWELKWQR